MQTQERYDLLSHCAAVLGKSEERVSPYDSPKEKRSSLLKNTFISKIKTLIKTASFMDTSGESVREEETFMQQQKLLQQIAVQKDSVVIYMKLAEFSFMKELYSEKILYLIESEVYKFIIQNKKNCGYVFDDVFQLGNGAFAMTFEKSKINTEMESFFQKLKEFQRIIHNRVLSIGNRRHYLSILVSISYDTNLPFQSAEYGIQTLLQNKKNFIISSDSQHYQSV